MAQVTLIKEAAKQFDTLPLTIKERVRKLLGRLQGWPAVSGAKPLTGKMAGWYRLRTGDYRLCFRVEKEQVIVEKIGHRKDVYDA